MENVNALMESLALPTRTSQEDDGFESCRRGQGKYFHSCRNDGVARSSLSSKVLNPEMTTDFFKMLSTHKASFIPRDLPEGLKIANKPGELEGVRNDSGVVLWRIVPT